VSVHSTASIHPRAELADQVSIGAYAQIEADVVIDQGCSIGPFALVRRGSQLGARVSLDAGVVVGGEPQDLKYRGEATRVCIGDDSRLREYVTVNRGTAVTGETVIGRQCLIMAYAHIAHDCRIGDGVVVANAVQMGGHVQLGDGSVISGLTGIHQFVAIGAGAFIGGGLRVDKDVPPGIKALGDPLRWGGLNAMGWERLGYPRECLGVIERFYRHLRANSPWLEAWHQAWLEAEPTFAAKPEAEHWKASLQKLFERYFAVSRRGLILRGEV
jgi:UDP-N-acetylglucosamine acyltransferase